ncbi:acyltransferase family protein [Methanobrevibacter sp. TMH8]|uniref:acyltransferase family protein n=1 Tax=Methanobrevibacter sp. TMH8 TaxID=2848611 RepID=UPI001CC9F826|nr:acyltransferase family protein [Methanobrevibacter sp. TMH8]MBZ9570598.1 acyltransferase family protein [Methanobrevibacter sp. TMH8]
MRKYYLDTLRLVTIFLVIILHIFLIYSTFPYYIKEGSNYFLNYVIMFFLVWLMPLLFAIAGITSFYALKKRSFTEYFKERVQRLLIPFISAMILLNPILSYFGMKFHENLPISYFNYYLVPFTKITDLTGYDGGLTLGPAWFILFLFIVSCLAIPIIKLLKDRVDFTNKKFSLPSIILLGLIPVVLYPILSSGEGKSIGMSLGFFLLGYFVLSNDHVMEKLEKNKILLGILTLILTIIFIVGNLSFSTVFVPIIFYYQAFYGWICILLLLVLGKIFLNKTSNLIQYLSESSFSIYIFHESILVAVGFYIIQIIPNIYVQMILILILTISLSLGLYILCKKFKVTRFIFGIK